MQKMLPTCLFSHRNENQVFHRPIMVVLRVLFLLWSKRLNKAQ